MQWPDTVIFGRVYPQHTDPIKIMRDYKRLGKRVLYDMDDDFWSVAKDNPSVNVSNALKDQYEGMIKEADAVITPSEVLAKKFKKYFKKYIKKPMGIILLNCLKITKTWMRKKLLIIFFIPFPIYFIPFTCFKF
jgi:hypothetical protein